MPDYVRKMNLAAYTEVCFYIEQNKTLAIGEKMAAIDENAYMNGYNWEAFFNCYLQKNVPELLDGMKTDPEAGMYVAYYALTPENENKVDKFCEIICDLIENEEKIYAFLRDYGAEIEWD